MKISKKLIAIAFAICLMGGIGGHASAGVSIGIEVPVPAVIPQQPVFVGYCPDDYGYYYSYCSNIPYGFVWVYPEWYRGGFYGGYGRGYFGGRYHGYVGHREGGHFDGHENGHREENHSGHIGNGGNEGGHSSGHGGHGGHR
jgi:hypothetical protein